MIKDTKILSFWYGNLSDTSLYPNFKCVYFYSIKFTFLRPLKAIESCHIAQWVSPLWISNTHRATCVDSPLGHSACASFVDQFWVVRESGLIYCWINFGSSVNQGWFIDESNFCVIVNTICKCESQSGQGWITLELMVQPHNFFAIYTSCLSQLCIRFGPLLHQKEVICLIIIHRGHGL